MRFSRKIFISVFLATFLIGSSLIWAAYVYAIRQSEERFVARYSVFTKILADTLNRMDLSTENLMLNAAKVVVEKDAAKGLPSRKELLNLQKELNVTHVFIADNAGKFIRSTNEAPEKIPNLFSFCSDYKKLIAGTSKVEATPVIQPQPEPKPFKFLSIPNANRSRIIEVGVRVDFIAKTLAEAIGADKNVLSMSLYSPDGTPFGKFTPQNVEFGGAKMILPSDFDAVPDINGNYAFYTKVLSSHPHCCQCDLAGTSKNGDYYYVLEAKVSKDELKALKATTQTASIILGFGNLLLAFIFSRLLSRRLVKNIEKAVKKVRGIKEHGDLKERVGLTGKDEVAFLTREFDRLLDTIEDSQKKVIEAEKTQTKVQMAKEIAHNINSPIVAIEMMIPLMPRLPDWIQKALKNSVKEIKTLAERLSNQADSLSEESCCVPLASEIVFLSRFLSDVVKEKEIEFSGCPQTKVILNLKKELGADTVLADSVDLKSIISNIINNAAESYPNKTGVIKISLKSDVKQVSIVISDHGQGISNQLLSQLGTRTVSSGKNNGKGLGLLHAHKVISAWGGNIKIASEVGIGTTVEINLKQFCEVSVRPIDGNVHALESTT